MPLLPLKDDNPIAITPYLTYGFIAFNILCFALSMGTDPQALAHNFMFIAEEYFGYAPPLGVAPEWLTPLTSSFLHAGLGHLAGNLFFFYIFADNLENTSTPPRFIVFCLMAAYISGIAQGIFDQDSAVPSLGFSGVVSACLGAYLILYPKAKIICLLPFFLIMFNGMRYSVRIPAWVLLLLFLLMDVAGQIQEFGNDEGGVAYAAHIAGFLFGVISAKFLKVYETDYKNIIIPKHKGPHNIRTRADEILLNHQHRMKMKLHDKEK
jgi:membrane associated rhomboid family serine protease